MQFSSNTCLLSLILTPCLCSLCLSLSARSPLPQFPPGVGRAPLPASLWYQAERLQSVSRAEHREGEVARFLKDEKGNSSNYNLNVKLFHKSGNMWQVSFTLVQTKLQ